MKTNSYLARFALWSSAIALFFFWAAMAIAITQNRTINIPLNRLLLLPLAGAIAAALDE